MYYQQWQGKNLGKFCVIGGKKPRLLYDGSVGHMLALALMVLLALMAQRLFGSVGSGLALLIPLAVMVLLASFWLCGPTLALLCFLWSFVGCYIYSVRPT